MSSRVGIDHVVRHIDARKMASAVQIEFYALSGITSKRPANGFELLQLSGKMAYILFRGEKRISLRDGDMNVSKIARIFQVTNY